MPAKRDSRGRFLKGSGSAGKVIDRDRGLKKILKGLDGAAGWRVTVGVHQSEDAARNDDGSFSAENMGNVAIAAIHEFGAPRAGIPERSFMRAGFDKNVRKYLTLLARGARSISSGTKSPRQVLGVLGEVAVADVVNLINAGIAPPNTSVTISAKGSSTPLIDTGQLKQSIKPIVTKK